VTRCWRFLITSYPAIAERDRASRHP